MLFQGLDRLKRSVLMTAIVLMFIGVMLMILPVSFIPYFSKTLGFVLLVALVFSIFCFLSSSKALYHHLVLIGGLAAGVLGALLLIFGDLITRAAPWLICIVPILLGIYGIYHAVVFARRSGRKGWFILIILSALLIGFGSVIFWNPWRGNTKALMMLIGGVLMFSSLISALSLIWIWPIHRQEGGGDA